jgi:hypothetical protein
MDKWCILAAQEICNKWSVGESSRFCDDPPDFDLAESSDVAVVIWSEYQRAIAAQSGTQAATEAAAERQPCNTQSAAIAKIAAIAEKMKHWYLASDSDEKERDEAIKELRQLRAL